MQVWKVYVLKGQSIASSTISEAALGVELEQVLKTQSKIGMSNDMLLSRIEQNGQKFEAV